MYSQKFIFQIGSHVGNTSNDPIFNEIDDTTRLILVEPVPYLFSRLRDNYITRFPKHQDNITFINKAVSTFVGTIELTIPSEKNDFSKLPFWATQLSSIHPDHAIKHAEVKDMITEVITVPTTTIAEILREHHVDKIDFLHIDTEGHDYDILMDYDFNVLPEKIMFECKHMSMEKYNILSKRLFSKGYSQIFKNYDDAIFEISTGKIRYGTDCQK
jgi:FkbM family methyltransferase